MNHVQQSSTQESPSIMILGAREWEMELLAIWQRGFYQVCALLWMGTEGAGVGDFIGEQYARVWSGGDGAGDTRQRVRRRGGGVAGGNGGGCAAKGVMGGGSAHGGGHACWGARVSGGVNDPDVCGLWFQESLPLCMVITPSVLFSCLL
jgi:hypothetical protein